MDKSQWKTAPHNASESGAFERDTSYIEDRIVEDVPSHSSETMYWPVEAGRYRLMGSRACPWAHRAIITRRLLGLEKAISLGLAGPTHDADSWVFDLDPEQRDPATGLHRLKEAYELRFPGYPKGITVPAIVEVESKRVVTNWFLQIPIDFNNEWTPFHRPGAPDLYPAELREEIDTIAQRVYTFVNNGVYRCGFAASQQAYDEAYRQLWENLDWLEDKLGQSRYLVGDHITLADIYLYPTLIRFDPVYYGHFKASRTKISEMPNLRGYLQELFQLPGFGDTTDFLEIKQHYYITHAEINPTGIVPQGPDLNWLAHTHDRARFGGSPFASHATLPGRVPNGEEVKNQEPFHQRG